MKSKKSLQLLVLGIVILTATQIASHYYEMSDFVMGSLVGIGIGVLITALIILNRKVMIAK